MPVTLLAESDDSDGDGAERRPPRRRLFHKSERGTRRIPLDVSFCHCLLLTVLSVSLIYVATNTYTLNKNYVRLQESVSALSLLATRMELVESGVDRLRLEFDLWRESASNESAPFHTTEYVHDVMKKLSTDVREMKRRVELASRVADDAIRRMTTVEQRCLNVCRQTLPTRERDKQRRRQAAKLLVSDDDQIVFRRT